MWYFVIVELFFLINGIYCEIIKRWVENKLIYVIMVNKGFIFLYIYLLLV